MSPRIFNQSNWLITRALNMLVWSLLITEPWALANKIMLNIIQSFKFDFLENKFWANCGVRFQFHFQSPTQFFHEIFFKYRGILELISNTNLFCENGSFANTACCGLTARFAKTKTCCNFANKRIKKIS